MAQHLRDFLADNKDLIEVKGSEHEELLRWAEELRLLSFERFGNREFYRENDLETARMWWDKYKQGVKID